MPCQWTSVPIGSSLVTSTSTCVADVEVDPRSRDHPVVGPRLDDLAGAHLPVDDRRSQLEALRAVGQHLRFQRLVAATFGLAGNARIESIICWSRAARLLGRSSPRGPRGLGAAALARRRVADDQRGRSCPESACPGMSQYSVYVPASRLLRSRVADSPGSMSGVDQIGAFDAEVVRLRAGVGHLDAAADVDRAGGEGDGELAQVGLRSAPPPPLRRRRRRRHRHEAPGRCRRCWRSP